MHAHGCSFSHRDHGPFSVACMSVLLLDGASLRSRCGQALIRINVATRCAA